MNREIENLDVIIPTWNSMPEFQRCLKSIKKAFPEDIVNNIIVVDRHSNDDTIEMAKRFGCDIIINDKSLGCARLDAIIHSSTKWITFIDSDIELPVNWFDKMKKFISDDSVGWVYGRAIADHPKIKKASLYNLRKELKNKPKLLQFGERACTNNTICLREPLLNVDVGKLKNLSAWEDQLLGQTLQSFGYKILEVPVACAHLRQSTHEKFGVYYQTMWGIAGEIKSRGRHVSQLFSNLWRLKQGLQYSFIFRDLWYLKFGIKSYISFFLAWLNPSKYFEVNRELLKDYRNFYYRFILPIKKLIPPVWPVFFRCAAFLTRKLTIIRENTIYICFFSSYFGGNVKPVLLYLLDNRKKLGKEIFPYFMSENKEQIEIARAAGVEAYWHHDIAAIPILAKTTLFVTTHGEGLPISRRKKFRDFLQDLTSEIGGKCGMNIAPSYGESVAKRVELWHGVGFKDVLVKEHLDFGVLVPPDILCVTSEFIKDWYIRSLGFDENIFCMTGFPRNDILFKEVDKNKILTELGFSKNRKTILYAPTWEQDFKAKETKNIFFWEPNEVLHSLWKVADEMNANLIIRTHGLWKGKFDKGLYDLIERSSNVEYVPMKQYPDTSELLAVTDVLITDWSSIATDFTLTKKPIIFIDTPDPFHGNFCLGPDDRAGVIVKTLDELIGSVKASLVNPENFVNKYANKLDFVINKSFKNKDGKATERVVKVIEGLLEK